MSSSIGEYVIPPLLILQKLIHKTCYTIYKMLLSQCNQDIIQCLIMAVNHVDDLKNLYLTSKSFQACLDDQYVIKLLVHQFNVIFEHQLEDNLCCMKSKDLLSKLKTYDLFKDKSDYYIKKHIGLAYGKKLATVEQMKKRLFGLIVKTILDQKKTFYDFIKHYGHLFVPQNIKYPQNNAIYFTQFNGCLPYKVVINDKIVNIYEEGIDDSSEYDSEEDDMSLEDVYQTMVTTFHPQCLFVGKSPLNDISEHAYDVEEYKNRDYLHIGDTLLLHLNDNNYVYIGTTIYSFQSLAKIRHFVSSVGRADVPYPYAVDEYNNFYLLIEDVIIKMNDIILNQLHHFNEPYCYYYCLKEEDEEDVLNKYVIQLNKTIIHEAKI